MDEALRAVANGSELLSNASRLSQIGDAIQVLGDCERTLLALKTGSGFRLKHLARVVSTIQVSINTYFHLKTGTYLNLILITIIVGGIGSRSDRMFPVLSRSK